MERIPEVEPTRFYVLSADTRGSRSHWSCPGCTALASHEIATKSHNNEFRERIRTIIEVTLTGVAKMKAYQDRVAEKERVNERKRARVERGARDVLMEHGKEEQVADRHSVASGEEEKQHEENRMRDVHIGKRESKTAKEEQPDKLRKTVRFEQEAPNTSSSSSTRVSLEYLASGEQQSWPGPYLRNRQVLWTTYKFLRWMHSTRRMDERVVTSEKCWNGLEEKMQEISKEVN